MEHLSETDDSVCFSETWKSKPENGSLKNEPGNFQLQVNAVKTVTRVKWSFLVLKYLVLRFLVERKKKRFMVLELSRQEITELLRQSCWLLLLHHEPRWPPMYNIKWENFKQSPVSSDRQQGSQGSGGEPRQAANATMCLQLTYLVRAYLPDVTVVPKAYCLSLLTRAVRTSYATQIK